MKKWLMLGVVVALGVTGCTSAEAEAEKEAQLQEDIWAASNDGPMPAHGAADIHSAIASIAERADRIALNGPTADDCEPFSEAFNILTLADFNDERQDYMATLKNATSQVYSACDGRDTWEGTADDLVDISDLGNEYAERF